MGLKTFRFAKISDERVGMAVADAVFRLEPFDLFHVLFVKAALKQVKPMGNRFPISFFNRREIRGGSLNYVGHEPNISESVRTCA